MTIDQLLESARTDTSRPNWKTTLAKPDQATFEAGRSYFANVATNKGPIRIKFMPEVAPMHVTSFLYLSKLGFFDGLAFHRVITGFMAQGGCPLGTGTGGPGYKFGGQFHKDVRHDRPGLLSMANSGPGTDGSQFFLTFLPTPWLDGKHTIFGGVEEGLEVLKELEAAGTPEGRPRAKITIESVRIEERA